MARSGLVLALALGAAAACHRGPRAAGSLLVERPYRVQLPARVDPARPLPVVVLLHGLGATAAWQSDYFMLGPLADAKGFLLALPDGTRGAGADRFWNGTDACCDFDGLGVDDVRYLDALLDDVSAHHRVDPKRVYLIGFSNGGFMAHRFACERAARVAGFASVAGAGWMDASRCRPSEPVAALQVHGDADAVVFYQGGFLGGGLPRRAPYPSARGSLEPWLRRDRCHPPADADAAGAAALPPLDLNADVAGAETTRQRWDCAAAAVELWTVHGGGHVPRLSPGWAEALWSFLSAQAKP